MKGSDAVELGVRGKRWLGATAEAVLASVTAVGLFASGSFFPVLGIGLSLLSPLPFVAVRLRHGRTTLALALALTTLMLAVPLSFQQGIIFLLEFGAPAVVLGECLRRGARAEAVVIGVAAVLAVGGVAVLVVASGEWEHPVRAIGQHLDALLADMEALTARVGIAEGPGGLEMPTRQLRSALLVAFPGLLFVGSLLTAASYVLVLQAMVRRWPAQFGATPSTAFRWEMPELLVWGFIGSGLGYLTGIPWLKAIGVNGLIIFLSLYFLQGLSIVAFLFRRFHLPRSLATLSVILLVFQPFFTLLVAGLGLFDVWFGFRRLSLPKPPGQT
ncbi:MAG TPA: DUF2232 domain-containing protein [Candidatus Methylomirabilis sp.]